MNTNHEMLSMNYEQRKPDGGLSEWIETYEAMGFERDETELLCLLLELRRRREKELSLKQIKCQKLMEHSGCGRGAQVDMLTVRMRPGEVVVQMSEADYKHLSGVTK